MKIWNKALSSSFLPDQKSALWTSRIIAWWGRRGVGSGWTAFRNDNIISCEPPRRRSGALLLKDLLVKIMNTSTPRELSVCYLLFCVRHIFETSNDACSVLFRWHYS